MQELRWRSFAAGEVCGTAAHALAVLFVSGYPQDVLQRVGNAEWVQAVLHKPYTTAQIARALCAALAERRVSSTSGA